MNFNLRALTTTGVLFAGTCVAFASSASAAVNTPYKLDAFNGAAGATFSGPAASPTILRAGKLYTVRVRGAVSLWAAKNIASTSRFTICGAPEVAPRYLGADGKTGRVGVDAETRFGMPLSSGICPAMPFTSSGTFELSTNGSSYYDPTPFATPANHSYRYGLVGSGTSLRARFADPSPSDNYGAFQLRVQVANFSDCQDNGWRNFPGISGQVACKIATLI